LFRTAESLRGFSRGGTVGENAMGTRSLSYVTGFGQRACETVRDRRTCFYAAIAVVGAIAVGFSTPYALADDAGTQVTSDVGPQIVYKAPPASFFNTCAFVCIDIQEGHGRAGSPIVDIPEAWKRQGYTVADCNAAADFLRDVCMPNARLVADACRELGLPMIFVHWGFLFDDRMDMEPALRRLFAREMAVRQETANRREDREQADRQRERPPIAHSPGDNRQPGPAKALGVRDGEYVIPKTARDAFISSNIDFVLRNLGVENLVMIGGHANVNGCLFRTIRSAQERGYGILVVEDATYDAGESTRKSSLARAELDYIMTTETFVALTKHIVEMTDKP